MEHYWTLIIVMTVTSLFLMFMYWRQKANVAVPEVYCVGKNVYRYTAAKDLATQLGARLATPDELHQTCHWNVLGWCDGGKAYTCNGKLRGGKMPGQLKLGVYLYGFKPHGKIVKELLLH
jgi:hypothetical protein